MAEQMAEQATYLGTPIAEWAAALGSSDPLERRLAAHALGELGPAARDAVSDLHKALADPIAFVRVWAAAALARVDQAGEVSIAALIVGMKDQTAMIRSLAAWHLGRLGVEFPRIAESLPMIRELLGDKDPSVRTEAALALRNLEGKGAPPLELWSLCRAPESGWQLAGYPA